MQKNAKEEKMSENTKEPKKEQKVTKKTEKTSPKDITKLEKAQNKQKKNHKLEPKSIQNKVIENIKNFITKIMEMQQKVKHDEEVEKEQKKAEENEAKTKPKINEPQYLLEYYDLPFRYNETVVKILAQTPKKLFVYWDVSDKDKQTYLNAFGEHFFNDTYPVLLVHNESKNITSEIPINDFANSWYIDISNPRDQYIIQLGRKFKSHIKPQLNPEFEQKEIPLKKDYLFIAMSNKLEVPNDHILFEEFKPYVTYRNVKTSKEEIKNVETSLYQEELTKLYKQLYPDERLFDENGKFDMLNPSSAGTSSSIAK